MSRDNEQDYRDFSTLHLVAPNIWRRKWLGICYVTCMYKVPKYKIYAKLE